MSDDLRARAHNFVAYFEQQLRSRLRTEERAALERIIAAKFGFDDDALRAAVEAETKRCGEIAQVLLDGAVEAERAEKEKLLALLERCVEVMEFAYMNAAEQPREIEEARAAVRARKP